MANEIQFSAAITVQNGKLQASHSVQFSADQAAPGSVQRKQTIATTGTTLTLTGVTTPRTIIIENLDPTNYVDIGPDSGGMVGTWRLLPGQACPILLLPGVVLKGLAHTADVAVELTIFNA